MGYDIYLSLNVENYMGKSLVIVESPAKAKTINKYLGKDFIVKSSIGHIRDLPVSGAQSKKSSDKLSSNKGTSAASKKNQAWNKLVLRMGVDPLNKWEHRYEVLPGKEKVVKELRKLALNADVVFLATDLDREGEAIAWHLKEEIGDSIKDYKRVTFNEITKSAIHQAFSTPSDLNIDRIHAQQARRFLDRVVGFMLSPLLWAKVARGLSAGRVQSVAVKLIVEREREINKFKPEEFWEVKTSLLLGSTEVLFAVTKQDNNNFRPTSKKEIESVLKLLNSSSYVVSKHESKPTESKPSPPFITSTLQQTASTRLGFGVKKTMILAQKLYEAGFITYMRTDSTSLSQDAQNSVRSYITKKFDKNYLPEQPNIYAKKKNAQEAHEAIRPSDVNCLPKHIHDLDRDAIRLYEIIWQQFVACQMNPAKYLSTTVTVTAGDFELKTKGRVVVFDGYTRVLQAFKKSEDIILPADLKEGVELKLESIDPRQLFTRPSARFTEASLVKELEKKGIGRPSTYASIISTIQDRGYVSIKKKRFYAEKIGDIVTDRLNENFCNLMDYNFTAKMEEQLDEIAEGHSKWRTLLDEFFSDFKSRIDNASEADGMRINEPVVTKIECPKCSRHMQIRTASTGVFLGCSGYSLPVKERCRETINLVSSDEIAAEDEFAEIDALRSKKRCSLCARAMDSYFIDSKKKLHICGNNPDCSGNEIEYGDYKIKGYEGPVLDCDKCGSEMQLKSGRFGKYFGCMNEECKNTRKLLKSGQPAPPKMDPVPMPELKCEKVDDHYILRDGASGLFLAASKFPKNRETKAPHLIEIIKHKKEIDKKYHFLMSGPTHDSDENPSIIRYSRKNKEQYLMTEHNGKATGWTALFKEGSWHINSKLKKK